MTALLFSRVLDNNKLALARYWQRKGLTFTEIADKLRIERSSIVQALYWDVVR